MEPIEYHGYSIVPRPIVRSDGRYTVNVEICRARGGTEHRRVFHADDGIAYLLHEEASYEAYNLARRLIDRGAVRL